MTVKNEKTIKELFDKVYGISYYGEHFNDAKNSMGIPYEFESNEKISEINSEIYSLKCKIVEEHKGKNVILMIMKICANSSLRMTI